MYLIFISYVFYIERKKGENSFVYMMPGGDKIKAKREKYSLEKKENDYSLTNYYFEGGNKNCQNRKEICVPIWIYL